MNDVSFSVLLPVSFVLFLLDRPTDSIRLEHRSIDRQRLKYTETQLVERHDLEKNLRQCRELVEMLYTEEFSLIDSIRHVERRVSSLRIVPPNPTKRSQLVQSSRRPIGTDDSTTRPLQLSSTTGHVLLSAPNEPPFPVDDLQIGSTWTLPLLNSLGQVEYNLTEIDEQNEVVWIELEGQLPVIADALLTGRWKFHSGKGITLQLDLISTSSVLADQQFTQFTNKTLLSSTN